MSWTPEGDGYSWNSIPDAVQKILAPLPSTAKVLVKHLLSLESDVKKHEKSIQSATKLIQSNRAKQAKTLDEISELKTILVSTYKLNVDTIRVLEKL
jgi:hypothetical protein